MKITRLVLQNCRVIDRAELSDLGDIVVIVGPNGSGKSTLFDAIRIFKSSLGCYSHGVAIHNLYPNFVTLGKDCATIDLTLAVTAVEQQLLECDKSLLRGVIHVDEKGAARLVSDDDRHLLSKLFSQYAREHDQLGKIDHLPSERGFRRGPVSGSPFDPGYHDAEWYRAIEDTTSKFDKLKLDLWRMDYADLAAGRDQVEPHPGYMAGVAELFRQFLGDIEFVGIRGGLDAPPKVLVRTPRGEHDIDLLSAGQQQILMTYAYLQRRKFTNSVVLFDSPELHLHATVERKVIGHLRGLAKLGNQFWLATHSPEILTSCKKETVYRLTGEDPNTAERVDVRAERIQTLKALGASLHVQMVSRRIVYVEGESDAELLECLEPRLAHEASFIPAGGVSATGRVIELLNEATEYENFRAIRDRDYLTEDDIADLEGRANGRLFVWRRYHIENYLLDEAAILEVIQGHRSLRLTKFTGAEDVAHQLRLIADQLRTRVVAARLERCLDEVLFKRVNLDASDIQGSLQKLVKRRLPQVQETLDAAHVAAMHERVEAEVNATWNTRWIELCPGRAILQEFCKQRTQGPWEPIYPILKELVAKKITELDRLHPDVRRVIGSILDDERAD